MRTQSHEKMKNITLSAMFAAVILLTTVYFFHIPMGTNGGYIHFGDAFIYLAGCFLPIPYACASAAIGAGLADIMSGSAVWAIPTMIIKPLMALWFTNKRKNLLNKRNIIAVIPAGIIMIAGYYLAAVIIMGNWISPMLSVGGNFIQALGSGIIFMLVSMSVDRVELKKRLQQI